MNVCGGNLRHKLEELSVIVSLVHAARFTGIDDRVQRSCCRGLARPMAVVDDNLYMVKNRKFFQR